MILLCSRRLSFFLGTAKEETNEKDRIAQTINDNAGGFQVRGELEKGFTSS